MFEMSVSIDMHMATVWLPQHHRGSQRTTLGALLVMDYENQTQVIRLSISASLTE